MRYVISVVLFFITLAVPVLAKAIDTQCVLNKYNSYASAQEKWQLSSTGLVVKTNANLKGVAMIYLADQLNYIEMNRIAVNFMLNHNPGKIKVNAPLNQWLSIGNEEKLAIAKNNNRYAELLKLADAAKKRPAHPDGNAIKALMMDHVIKTAEYKNLLDQFNIAVANANNINCGDLY